MINLKYTLLCCFTFILNGIALSQPAILSNNLDKSIFVCDVTFKDTTFSNPHAGSAFLVKTDMGIIACTAKHVLYFAKSDQMDAVDFKGTLDRWEFHPKGNTTFSLTADRLLNADPDEKLQGMFTDDWLLFSLDEKNIPSNTQIFEIRETPLKPGEEIWFTGYPYKGDQKPLVVKGEFTSYKNERTLIADVPKAHYNGCSGGPVVDMDGKLVGIVSMGFYDEKSGKNVFEPASVAFLSNFTSNKGK